MSERAKKNKSSQLFVAVTGGRWMMCAEILASYWIQLFSTSFPVFSLCTELPVHVVAVLRTFWFLEHRCLWSTVINTHSRDDGVPLQSLGRDTENRRF
jgi:hypothetical protein